MKKYCFPPYTRFRNTQDLKTCLLECESRTAMNPILLKCVTYKRGLISCRGFSKTNPNAFYWGGGGRGLRCFANNF